MSLLSKRSRSRQSATITFARKVCEMVRRGDVDLIVDALKGYWRDKKQYPWHRITKELANKGLKTMTKEEISECVGLLRDGIFAALELMSLNLALDISITELLDMLLKESSWNRARQKVRTHCITMAKDLIDKGKLDLLSCKGLEHDGLRFLVPDLLRKRLKMLEDACPILEEGVYDLTPLHKCILGRHLLRRLSITEKKLPEDDPRAEELLTLHSNLLLDLELEESSYIVEPEATAQTTLNGEILPEEESEESPKEKPVSKPEEEVQVPLTEYITKEEKEKKKKKKEKRTKRKIKKSSERRKSKEGEDR